MVPFPSYTVRIVHDPEDPLVSYALSISGLFVSFNRGVSWQITSIHASNSIILAVTEAAKPDSVNNHACVCQDLKHQRFRD